ncbi:dNA-binding helix-turn-helix protein [Firmicutes bacterium CAG:646]|nr:dNA-binding helix-turn-helix protein [Firmicutes bacterium CAG:646]
MKDRIKELRKRLDLTQQEFAEKIGISRGNIAAYEVGKNAPSDAVISLICREFNVNEEWLRTGTGEIFVSLTKKQVITDFMGDLIVNEEDSFKQRLIEALAKLSSEDWESLEKIAENITKKS